MSILTSDSIFEKKLEPQDISLTVERFLDASENESVVKVRLMLVNHKWECNFDDDTFREQFKAPFYFIHFDTASGITKKYTSPTESVELTKEQQQFLVDYVYNLFSIADWPVWAYEPDADNLYRGMMNKSDAEKRDWKWAIEAPEFPVAKFNEEKSIWERIFVVIRTDGSYQENPDMVCDMCMEYYTKEEWEHQPHPSSHYERFDFDTREWKDSRAPESVSLDINNVLTYNYCSIDSIQRAYSIASDEWTMTQYHILEAQSYLKDLQADTPRIDAYISAAVSINKLVYARTIVDRYDSVMEEFSLRMAYGNGIKIRANACTTLEEALLIKAEVDQLVNSAQDVLANY